MRCESDQPCGMRTFLRLEGAPSVPMIAATREYVRSLYDSWLGNPDLSERVAMVAHELLENLGKYATGEPRELETELARRDGRCYVRIRTTNSAASEQIAVLRDVVDELRASTDPLETYRRFVTRSSKSSVGSCLGLARIHAEANMSVSYSIAGSEVTIIAEVALESGREP